ncbi:MAG: hypothetical protein RL032_1112 [Pseudomonadota bacterium]|jgi:hypothetical protein
MTDLRQAAQQALEALEHHSAIKHPQQIHYRDTAIAALRTALEQPEQEAEPVAWMVTYGGLTHIKYTLPSKVVDTHYQPLYTTPPAAQPEQQAEPVAQQYAKLAQHCTMLEHKLAQRKPLTDEHIAFLYQNSSDSFDFARAIENAHNIKE